MNKYSSHKIVWFPDKLVAMSNHEITAPICVRVKPTNRCCHNCQFCVYKPKISGMHETANRTDEISGRQLIAILDDLADMGVRAITFSGGGEPLFHPWIEKAMETVLCRSMGLSIITNGQHLNETRAQLLCKAKWVRISMDYYNAEMMVNSRQVDLSDFKTVVANIRWFKANKNHDCDLSVNYIVTADNYTTLYEAAQFMKGLGVEIVRFSPVWVPDFENYHRPLRELALSEIKAIRTLEDKEFHIYHSYGSVKPPRILPFTRCYFSELVPLHNGSAPRPTT